MARHRSLEINEDYSFQKAEWAVQRLGWLLIGLVIAAALLGLLGKGGPFATAHAAAPQDLLTVEYQRYARPDATHSLIVHLAPAAQRAGQTRIWIGGEYLQDVELKSVSPEPVAVEVSSGGHTFVFPLADTSQPFTAEFRIMPLKPGRRTIRLGLTPGEPLLTLPQLVYP